jgi:mRNA interferase RelE/StbE
MASYELVIKRSVAKDLRSIPKSDVKRIVRRIQSLADDPRPPGCEKLSGRERYRVRQGIYRVLYEIHDRRVMVVVVKVAKRESAYRNR